jgi:alkanesulfonate monooxygenase SsuD/methylene tetrahydromethanopterin reductase-like flavin-dependent oxidoreductase (luciferase family)
MRFGVFYELQLPRPWNKGDEHRLFHQALEQVVVADRLGFDYAWEVEHHFLEEYSHSSSPEVFLAAAAARTTSIRLGHGIKQVIPNYNHPARTAECLATLDIISDGRVDFGFGEGATRLELGGFRIPAREKRAMALEAAEQIANMMVLEPYPGFEGQYFTMPCRNVLPKPVQSPHPPLWMACTNRDTIKIAAQNGVGALAFSFLDPEQARLWSDIYYDIIKSDACVPLGHGVNANIAGLEGFEFFGYAINALVAHDTVPGRSTLWSDFMKDRGTRTEEAIAAAERVGAYSSGIGTPQDMRQHLAGFQESGVDQVILLQQAGRNQHEHICESLELFASEVMPAFKQEVAAREARKAEDLAPFIAAALKRKRWMKPLAEHEIPVVKASAARAQFARGDEPAQAQVSDQQR